MAIDKGKLHHYWRLLKRIKLWLLIVAGILFALSSAYLLRQNNLGMVSRRQAVLATDQQNGDVDTALKNLRSFMMQHMNTRMSQPIQLKYSYERAVQKQVADAAKSGSTTDASAYQRAQDECRASNTVTYAQCVIDKTSQVAPGSDPITQIKPPPTELFSYQFYSPTWSPDLAGFAVLALFLTLLLLIVRIIAAQIVRLILRRHQ
ncbi:MAG TPA: hypothetical protein VLF60_00475 [Candidatus Saccharimonadales bacterium]|nr:hypothetical protein [Candidatus Saccharimonadales bacterium]